MVSPVYVALDVPTMDEALGLATLLVDEVGGFKVGLELMASVGPDAIRAISDLGRPVFADLKLHDIPNTVRGAATGVAAAGARWVTVHAAGGAAVIQAAREGMGGAGVLAVTVLTSIGADNLKRLGITHSLEDQVVALAGLAAVSGAEGVVCSPNETHLVSELATGLTIFTPGVRPKEAARDDQARVATPAEAVDAGADYLVIGRPITRAPAPLNALREINASIVN